MYYLLTSLLEKVSRRRRIVFYPSIHLWVQPYFIYLLYSLLLIKNELRLQQLAKTKSKTYIQHPPMIWTHFWKMKGYLTQMFHRSLFRKLDARCQTTKNFSKYKLLHLKLLHPHFSSPNNIKVWHYVMLNFYVIY